jgi:hypothetical protein
MQVADLLDSQVISGDDAQLLGAVGVETLEALSQSEPENLLDEIENANSHLGLVEQLPNLDQLVIWINEARNRLDEAESTPVTRLDEVVELIPISVVKAYPVSKESILKNKIEVGDVPVMDEFLEEKDLYVEEVRKIDSETSEIKATVREISPNTPTRKISSKEDIRESISGTEKAEVEPLERNKEFDLRKTATPEINAGRTLHSRAYIRGVLHPQPFRVKLGAFLSVLTLILIPLSLMAGGALLLFKDDHELVIWSAAVPAVLVILALMYSMFARPVKCRVCGQPFIPGKILSSQPPSPPYSLFGIHFTNQLSVVNFSLVPLYVLRDFNSLKRMIHSRSCESIMMVTGPSLTRATSIIAPKSPRLSWGPISLENVSQNDW